MSDLDAEAVRKLLPVFVHDLRNPLSVVVANLDFAMSTLRAADSDAREALSDSQAACELLRLLIDNLNALSVTRGATPADTAVAGVCEEAMRRVSGRASHSAVTLALDAGGGPRVRVDAGLLSLVVENLLGNAVQHAPPGSRVAVRVTAEGGALRVEVRDSGGAIPTEVRVAAASEAGQLKPRDDRARYSRGAGLLVARLAAERAGGRLELGGEGAVNVMAVVVPLPG